MRKKSTLIMHKVAAIIAAATRYAMLKYMPAKGGVDIRVTTVKIRTNAA